MLVLDALVPPALVLILHNTADQLVILLKEPLDSLLIDFRLAPQPVRYEGHRHPEEPLEPRPPSDSTHERWGLRCRR